MPLSAYKTFAEPKMLKNAVPLKTNNLCISIWSTSRNEHPAPPLLYTRIKLLVNQEARRKDDEPYPPSAFLQRHSEINFAIHNLTFLTFDSG